jgi:hypothetical protein
MRVEYVIEQAFDGGYLERDINAIQGIMVHRVGVDLKARPPTVVGRSALEICQAFQGKVKHLLDVARATGYQNPYTVIIGGDQVGAVHDGTIWQVMPLDEVGWHARRWSRGYIGVACIGDFRVQAPSRRQRAALVFTLAVLCGRLGLLPYKQIKAHGEVAGAHDGTKAPGQPNACPGDLLNMDLLRDDVALVLKARSTLHLSADIFTASLS